MCTKHTRHTHETHTRHTHTHTHTHTRNTTHTQTHTHTDTHTFTISVGPALCRFREPSDSHTIRQPQMVGLDGALDRDLSACWVEAPARVVISTDSHAAPPRPGSAPSRAFPRTLVPTERLSQGELWRERERDVTWASARPPTRARTSRPRSRPPGTWRTRCGPRPARS